LAKKRILKTISDLSKHFGKHHRTIDYWSKKGMPKKIPKVGWDLDKIEAWAEGKGYWSKDLDNQAEGAGYEMTVDDDIEEIKEKEQDEKEFKGKAYYDAILKKYQSKLKEIELKQVQGELISLADVEKGWKDRILETKQTMLAMPRVLAPQLVDLKVWEIEKRLNDWAVGVCRRFSEGHE